jgi:hypothetical protein
MTATTYDVRIWEMETYKGKRVTSYRVRWTVAGERFGEVFRKSAQAESLRSELLTAARRGEAFFVATGLPVSKVRAEQKLSWYQFAIEYTDVKWKRAAATSRRTDAEALTAITIQMFSSTTGMPDEKLLRRVLKLWPFNTTARDTRPVSADERRALRWAETHTRDVSALNDPAILRGVLHQVRRDPTGGQCGDALAKDFQHCARICGRAKGARRQPA